MQAPEVQAIFDAMPAPKRDAVQIALAAAHLSDLTPTYPRAQQEVDCVVAVFRLQHADYLRILKCAIGALLDGRVRAQAVARLQEKTGVASLATSRSGAQG